MFGTQNETWTKAEGGRQKVEHSGRPSSFRLHPSAFTLTELLIVIAIIATLAALLLPAIQGARNKAKQTAITLELQQIAGAMEDLKNDFGAYPPNGMNNGDTRNQQVATLVPSDFKRMFKKAFPRSKEPNELIDAIAAAPNENVAGPSRPTIPRDASGGQAGGGLTAAESVYFWLGGFSEDTSYPISGPGGPSFLVQNNVSGNGEVLEDRNRRYDFDLTRLGPRQEDGTFDDTVGKGRFVTYRDPRPGASNNDVRRINLWVYTPDNSNVPVQYFDTSRHSPAEYDVDMTGLAQEKIYALKQLREGVSTATEITDIRWVQDGTFQLLHPGVDDTWGDAFAAFQLKVGESSPLDDLLLAPEGPFIGDIADTLGHFMDGTLEDKAE